MKNLVYAFLLCSLITNAQDSTGIITIIPAQSQIIQDSSGFRVLQTKERPNHQDAFYVRHSQLLDSSGLEVYLFRVAMAELSVQEDSTRFNELSDAYTAFTNLSIVEVRRMRVLGALQGDWTVKRISDGKEWQGTFQGEQFKIGNNIGVVTVETSISVKIVGLPVGDLYLTAKNKDVLRGGGMRFTRN